MKKVYNSVSLGGYSTRHTVKFTSLPCEKGTSEYRFYQHQMLRQISDNTDLLKCGISTFNKMSMYHDGECWVVDMEAIEEHQ